MLVQDHNFTLNKEVHYYRNGTGIFFCRVRITNDNKVSREGSVHYCRETFSQEFLMGDNQSKTSKIGIIIDKSTENTLKLTKNSVIYATDLLNMIESNLKFENKTTIYEIGNPFTNRNYATLMFLSFPSEWAHSSHSLSTFLLILRAGNFFRVNKVNSFEKFDEFTKKVSKIFEDVHDTFLNTYRTKDLLRKNNIKMGYNGLSKKTDLHYVTRYSDKLLLPIIHSENLYKGIQRNTFIRGHEGIEAFCNKRASNPVLKQRIEDILGGKTY